MTNSKHGTGPSQSPMRHVLVTGGAGFIGSHVVDRLLRDGNRVTAIDNFDDFYPALAKHQNIKSAARSELFSLVQVDIRDAAALAQAVPPDIDVIVHLAARAGVRPSIEQPLLSQDVNVRGTHVLLELARSRGIGQFVFASSSSVYGVDRDVPWKETSGVLRPISPYASTKVSGELLGHVYSHLFGIRFVALRFFTVYGPRQRPDLAIRKFATLMLRGDEIPMFGDGATSRDYTYVDDTVSGVIAATRYTATPFEVINLGNNRTVTLRELIASLESALGIVARVRQLPEQPGDVPITMADTEKAGRLLGYSPSTPLDAGLATFVTWLRNEGILAIAS